MANYDLIVIGAGPAGYEGAIRAAQLGKKVACVDRGTLRQRHLQQLGLHTNQGAPQNAELYHDMKDRAAEFGFAFDALNFDWSKIVKRSRVVSEKGSAGVDFLFKKNKIDPLRGEASLDKPGEVKVRPADGKEETHSAKNILIATGCVSRPLPGLPFDGKKLSAPRKRSPWNNCLHPLSLSAPGHRHRIRLHLQCIRHESDRCRNASQHSPNRGHRGLASAGKSLSKQGIQLLTNHKTTKRRRTTRASRSPLLIPRAPKRPSMRRSPWWPSELLRFCPGGSLKSAWMRKIHQGQ